jgi:hypothetical protein
MMLTTVAWVSSVYEWDLIFTEDKVGLGYYQSEASCQAAFIHLLPLHTQLHHHILESGLSIIDPGTQFSISRIQSPARSFSDDNLFHQVFRSYQDGGLLIYDK